MTIYRITIEIPEVRFTRPAVKIPNLSKKELSKIIGPAVRLAVQFTALTLSIVVGANTPRLIDQFVRYFMLW